MRCFTRPLTFGFLIVSAGALSVAQPSDAFFAPAESAIPASDAFTSPSTSSSSRTFVKPATNKDRFDWAVENTIGPQSLLGGLFSAAIDTGTNSPKEYGTHWDGYGKRYAMNLSGVAASNAMEAGLGSLWGEDPRYLPAPSGTPMKSRMGRVIKMTFLAQDRNGNTMPAYARIIAIPGSNFISNTWRPDSDATAGNAAIRTGLGFLGRMGSNTWSEFWPDFKQHLFHH